MTLTLLSNSQLIHSEQNNLSFYFNHSGIIKSPTTKKGMKRKEKVKKELKEERRKKMMKMRETGQ